MFGILENQNERQSRQSTHAHDLAKTVRFWVARLALFLDGTIQGSDLRGELREDLENGFQSWGEGLGNLVAYSLVKRRGRGARQTISSCLHRPANVVDQSRSQTQSGNKGATLTRPNATGSDVSVTSSTYFNTVNNGRTYIFDTVKSEFRELVAADAIANGAGIWVFISPQENGQLPHIVP